jgi:hypothetical protein
MTTVTFTYGAVIVYVTGSIGYNTDFIVNPLNLVSIKTPSGGVNTFYGGNKEVIGNLEIKGASYADGDGLRHWIVEHIRFKENQFSISAINNTNLGNGKNQALTYVSFWKDNLEGVFTLVAPGLYNINFPYRYLL